jgi:hypothetical protein
MVTIVATNHKIKGEKNPADYYSVISITGCGCIQCSIHFLPIDDAYALE